MDQGKWFHGSPLILETLDVGSTITPDRDLARVFSHKPSMVSQEFEGLRRVLKHTGQLTGYLYQIDEKVRLDEIEPHPHTTMGYGQEWLTRRAFKLRLLGPPKFWITSG